MRVKKAQNGKNVVTEKKLMPQWIDTNRKRMAGPDKPIDTAARKAAIKRGEFREDPKSGDLFPIRKSKSGSVVKKSSKQSKKK